MASFSSLFTSLTGAGFYYEKNPRHATYNFSQDGTGLYRNQPRFPFEYYVQLNLNNVGSAGSFISGFFNTPINQLMPLVKSVEMPSMKIDTTAMNQYNRKRLSQGKVDFEPVKIVFHDVCDGKTLKFWDMYYRYYFDDGNEPGVNQAKQTTSSKTGNPYSVEDFIANITPKINPDITSLPTSIKNLFQGQQNSGTIVSPTNDAGDKKAIMNIVEDTLDNHHFGFNLPQVQNIRNLIQSIEIFQVHGGRFNRVTLVNPRISAFSHDVLSYAEDSRTMELTFTIEYEYAFYDIQNLKLGESGSSTEFFEHGETLELPALAFNAQLTDFIESNNPLLTSDNPILQRIGKNVQSSIGSVTGAFLSDKVTRRISASALDGLAKITPTPYDPTTPGKVIARSFKSAASPTSSMYTDVNRTGGTLGG